MPDSSPYLSASLGVDLRALRKARGVTLQGLAESSGKSVGWLSQVERDISHPSIEELKALAKVLGVPVSIFFGQTAAVSGEEGYVVRSQARRRVGNRENGLTEELLSPDLTDDFEVIHSTFEAGSERMDFEMRPTQEVGYLKSGILRLWVGGRQFDLEPGDSFRIRGEPYRWANLGAVDATVIWVIAPPVY
jgi:transcriptional regulator with XRE-family HTH domain